MNERKTSISQAETYEEISEFWDNNDLTDYLDEMHEVSFEVKNFKNKIYISLDGEILKKIILIADEKQTTANELINNWMKEKVNEHQLANAND
jgi:predicted HicB family RNase H-like nuclease